MSTCASASGPACAYITKQKRTISDAFDQTESGQTLVDLMALDLLVGSGGVLSHAPRRQQAMIIMMDAFQPEGVTQLAVDSIFMMPQLGVLAQVNPGAATQVFKQDCLIHLGPCIAPIGSEGKLKIMVDLPSGKVEEEISANEIHCYPLPVGETAHVHLQPDRHFDLGAGGGVAVEKVVTGGVVGLVVDTRGRPLNLSRSGITNDHKTRWLNTLDLYP